eukprot:g19170.t1
MLMSIAESLVKDILPGSLVSAKVQDLLSLDSVAPLSFIAKALAPKHSLWQIELAIKVITFNLAQRERQELSQVGMRQDQFDDFIQDMQKGITSTHAEVKRFDSYAGGSAYQRICELLLRSIRDSVQHLTIVKKSVDDASRLLHEAKMAETDAWPQTDSDLNALKEKTSSKLKDDFQVAGQRFEQILNETTQLHRMATDHEVKTSQIQGELELKDEDCRKSGRELHEETGRTQRFVGQRFVHERFLHLRELQEKLRRMKQGTDRNKSEYQACKQDLEDERDTVVTRVKAAERLFDGQTQEIESLHQDLRNLLLEEAVLERLGLRVFGCAGLIPSGGQANGGGGLEKVREGQSRSRRSPGHLPKCSRSAQAH